MSDPSDESPPQGQELASDAGTRLRSFNRYELKYLVPHNQAQTFRDDLLERMHPDPFQVGDAYPVRSIYFDTRSLQFYWEKIDGIRFRRKVRVRHYGEPHDAAPGTMVFLEIKQRVSRVTQKRRTAMPLRDALALTMDHQSPIDVADAFTDEALGLCETLELQPTNLVEYYRDALVGSATDPGLRVTFDTNLRVRGSDLDLTADVPSRRALHPDLTIIEVKVNERIPFWLTELVASNQLQLVRVSKYCQGIEVLEQAPRSVFHMPTTVSAEATAPATPAIAAEH